MRRVRFNKGSRQWPQVPMLQCSNFRLRNSLLIMRDSSEPPMVTTTSGASNSSFSCADMARSVASMLPANGPRRLLCASHSTAQLAGSAARQWASEGDGGMNPATISTLRALLMASASSFTSFCGMVVSGRMSSGKVKSSSASSATASMGSSICMLMCTGPRDGVMACIMASHTRRRHRRCSPSSPARHTGRS